MLQSSPSLFKWASNTVKDLGSRSKTLVSRVLIVGSNSAIATEAEFDSATKDKEVWTQTFSKSETINDSSSIQGLNDPVWRQTVLVDTGELIESTPWPPTQTVKIPNGPRDIKTTVWYGQLQARTQPRVKRNLFKGIQMVTAVFLLETMVLMSATAQGSGSWTQRMYGTGNADVWEVFGRDNLTDIS